MKIDKNTKLSIHLAVSVALAYLSWAILFNKKIPRSVGIALAVTAVAVAITHLYLYFSGMYACGKALSVEHGLSFSRDDPAYDKIGGMPGGVTWV